MQVAQHLGAAVAALPSHTDRQTDSQWLLYAYAVHQLVSAAAQEGLAARAAPTNSLALSLQQQLEHSRLPELIGSRIRALAGQLQAAAASARRISSSSSRQVGTAATSAVPTTVLQEVKEQLLLFPSLLFASAPPVNCSLTTDLVAAGAHLVVAALQYVSAQMQLLQGDCFIPDAALTDLLPACSASLRATCAHCISLFALCLVQDANYVTVLRLALMVLAYSSLLMRLPGLPPAQAGRSSGLGATGSSSSSCGHSGRSDAPAAALIFNSCAADRHPVDGVTALMIWQHVQAGGCADYTHLPAAHSQLAALLGCDTQTLVWAAAVLCSSASVDDCDEAMLYVTIHYRSVAQAAALQHMSPAATDEVHPLLMSVLLYWAAHRQGHLQDLKPGHASVFLTCGNVLKIWDDKRKAHQQQQQQELLQRQQGQEEEVQQQQQQQQPSQMPSATQQLQLQQEEKAGHVQQYSCLQPAANTAAAAVADLATQEWIVLPPCVLDEARCSSMAAHASRSHLLPAANKA